MKLGGRYTAAMILHWLRSGLMQLTRGGGGLYLRLLHRVGHLLFDRVPLILSSLLVLGVAAHVMIHLYDAVLTPANNVDEMVLEVEGISNLYLGIGLILKERQLLERVFGLDPSANGWPNVLCLHIGISLILAGTAMRLLTQLIRIPEHVISTHGMESSIFTIALVCCVVAALLLTHLIIRLVHGPQRNKFTGTAESAESGEP